MMKLCKENLNQPFWTDKGYILPKFDLETVAAATKTAPTWLHLGAGNIFRAFVAQAQQDVLDAGNDNKGIIVAEGFDYEIIDKAYRNFDNLCINVELRSDGSLVKSVVGSVVESLVIDTNSSDWQRMKDIFASPSLQMVSFTITEKGYNLKDLNMNYFPAVEQDFLAGPQAPQTYIGKVAALCYHRFRNGALPFAMVSMDNCSHNGDRLLAAVSDYAKHWSERGLCEADFYTYITDGEKVSFPWTAIDKITPRPDATVQATLVNDGLEDVVPVCTARKTYVAPFVNAEQTQYLVIEDHFPNGHPVLSARGVYFADRETVDKFEKMKVCTCLNPLHTTLAMFGCLLGYELICKEMHDEQLQELVRRIAYDESLPVVVDPGIVSPSEFLNTVLTVRFPNPFSPDSPQRIAMDTSQKLPIRFGETIKAYERSESLDVKQLKYIPLVHAAWCRYLMAIDDEGKPFEPSYDPMLESLQPFVKDVRLGAHCDVHQCLQPILSNEKIFGVDLYKVGLGETVERYFAMLTRGTGAVRQTLKELLS